MRTIFSLAIAAFLALAGTAHGQTVDVYDNIAKTMKSFERTVVVNRDNEHVYCSIASTDEAAIVRQRECQVDHTAYRSLLRQASERQIAWQFAVYYSDKRAEQLKSEFDTAYAMVIEQGKLLDRKYPKPYTTGQR